MRTALVDTGAWIALLSQDDDYFERALAHYKTLTDEGARLVTTNYVIDETATRLRYSSGLPATLAFRSAIDEAVGLRRLRVVWIDERLEREGWKVLEQYADVTLSLTDAVSGAVARRSRITEVFGFDRDFEALGLLVLPLSEPASGSRRTGRR